MTSLTKLTVIQVVLRKTKLRDEYDMLSVCLRRLILVDHVEKYLYIFRPVCVILSMLVLFLVFFFFFFFGWLVSSFFFASFLLVGE